MPDRMVAETELWRCGCVLERKTSENVCGSKRQSASLLGRCVAADARACSCRNGAVEVRVRTGARDCQEYVWQQTSEHEPGKVCGSKC